MNKKAIAIFFLVLNHTAVGAFTLKDCGRISSAINRDLPQFIDKITILKSTTCARDGKRVKLIYVNEITVNDFDLKNVQEIYSTQLNQWCTNIELRRSFALADIDYVYFKKNGEHIGTNSLKFKDCKK